VTEVCDGDAAVQQLEETLFEVVLADLRLPEATGLQLLHAVQTTGESIPLLMLIEVDDRRMGSEALKQGAYDYLVKTDPINLEEVQLRVERALESRRMGQALSRLQREHLNMRDGQRIISQSVHLQRILNRFQREIATSAHVMIVGEPGTGKGLLATAMHAKSPRSRQLLVAVNCAELPERALESELFGHERGAFPGAQTRYIGGVEHANGGTLFLQQVGDLSPRMQSKVLRLLRERTFERLGSSRTIHVDVRVLASTGRSLAEATQARRFRADLYKRLSMIRVEMPALCHCPEDILPLAEIFLQRYNRLFGRRIKRFEEGVQRALLAYTWPGNLRELESTIAHGVSQESGESMRLNSLGLGQRGGRAGQSESGIVRLPANGVPLKDIEREALIQALERTNWVQKEAAAHLAITPRVMHYKLKTLGIIPPGRSPRR
jgi:DNA-binding NtrC family response regulator